MLAQDMAEVGESVHTNSLVALMKHLLAFYIFLSQDPNNPQLAAQSARNFCMLGKEAAEQFWRIKPKFHLFMELSEKQAMDSGKPAHFWTYADESCVGSIGKIAGVRGGKRLAGTIPNNVIDKYRASV